MWSRIVHVVGEKWIDPQAMDSLAWRNCEPAWGVIVGDSFCTQSHYLFLPLDAIADIYGIYQLGHR